MPLLSIILPVYNGAPFLQRAVESVINQTLQSWELILVNDGSTDNTESICKEYLQKEKRIHYISQDNRGLSAARNAGFSYAVGQYIAFLDADDFISPTYYEQLIHEQKNHPADFIVTGFIREFHHENGEKHITTIHWEQKRIDVSKQIGDACRSNKFYHIYIHVWNKLYRRDFLQRYRITFDETLRYGEDVPYNIRVLSHCSSILFSEHVGYHYVCHSSLRLTNSWNDTLLKSNAHIYRQIVQHESTNWHIEQSSIAAGMYLRGCFLSLEKAINCNLPSSKVLCDIGTILEMTETNDCIQALTKHHISAEFFLYCLILRTKNQKLIYLSVLLRRKLKIILGR